MSPPGETEAARTLPGATGLERIFEAVSTGIDAAGPDRAQLFLARLCLLLAEEVGDPDRVLRCVADARIAGGTSDATPCPTADG